MFEALTNKLSSVFSKITSRGVLSEKDIDDAMREIRVALLEADVSLPVVKSFIAQVKQEALGEKVVRSINPGQMVVKIVHDALIRLLGSDSTELNLNTAAPVVLLLVGLQGAGKTTTAAKLGVYLKKKRKVLLASLDVYRPAAQEQLAFLGTQVGIDTLPVIKDEKPLDITRRALKQAQIGLYDILILDTAGRSQIDAVLMDEAAAVKKLANPSETLLVADAMIGQEACNVAREFKEKLGVTGLILTRVDGSSRCGAALSMKSVADVPIKFLGTGEKTDALEVFHPDRLAGRILGQGDVVSLVERAMETADKEETAKMAGKMMSGRFDLNDMLTQLRQIRKLGNMGSILSMIPGISKFKDQIQQAGVGDQMLTKQEAVILSMTKEERAHPEIIKASRKKRIALGAGVEIHEVNKLLKSYEQMSTMMKKMGQVGSMAGFSRLLKRGSAGAMFGGLGKRF
jgi:signal recognition particle subunit SRP54